MDHAIRSSVGISNSFIYLHQGRYLPFRKIRAPTAGQFLDEMEKRLQKRIIVKARGTFHMEDFEIRSPGEKPLEKSEMASAGKGQAEERTETRRRRKRHALSPAEMEAALEEEERNSVNPEALAEAESTRSNGMGAADAEHDEDDRENATLDAGPSERGTERGPERGPRDS